MAGKASSKAQAAAATIRPRAFGLSRERIVNETLKYLRDHPHEPLTIARAAAAVGAATMAVYRHFRDGADLAEALVARALEGLSDEIPRDADWRIQVKAWMDAIYGRLLETPQTVDLLTTTNGLSVAWVRTAVPLRSSLAAAGLRDPELTEVAYWISITIVGSARQMLAAPLSTHIEGAVAAIRKLDGDELSSPSELSALLTEIPKVYERTREIMAERILASVEVLVERSHAPKAKAPRRPR